MEARVSALEKTLKTSSESFQRQLEAWNNGNNILFSELQEKTDGIERDLETLKMKMREWTK